MILKEWFENLLTIIINLNTLFIMVTIENVGFNAIITIIDILLVIITLGCIYLTNKYARC